MNKIINSIVRMNGRGTSIVYILDESNPGASGVHLRLIDAETLKTVSGAVSSSITTAYDELNGNARAAGWEILSREEAETRIRDWCMKGVQPPAPGDQTTITRKNDQRFPATVLAVRPDRVLVEMIVSPDKTMLKSVDILAFATGHHGDTASRAMVIAEPKTLYWHSLSAPWLMALAQAVTAGVEWQGKFNGVNIPTIKELLENMGHITVGLPEAGEADE
jgi:hypothetical protein